MDELWKRIDGYDKYEVSSLGNIRRNSKELKPSKNTWGYLGVFLYKNGISKRFQVHRLVALSYIENKFNKKEVNHIDGNKLNNSIGNLEWCSRSENQKHAYALGLQVSPMKNKKGELNHRSKPTLQYEKDGTLLRRFASVADAGKFIGLENNKNQDNASKSIWKCCNFDSKTSYGYIWRFE